MSEELFFMISYGACSIIVFVISIYLMVDGIRRKQKEQFEAGMTLAIVGILPTSMLIVALMFFGAMLYFAVTIPELIYDKINCSEDEG